MNKKELLKKALKEFDAWPYPGYPSMIYCIKDVVRSKKGELSNFDLDSCEGLDKEYWEFVCTREEFEAAKLAEKPKFERFYMHNSKEAQEYLFSLGYAWSSVGQIFKYPDVKYVFTNVSGWLTHGDLADNNDGELRELPVKTEKPIYTQAMFDAGEKPKVGMYAKLGNTVNDIYLNHHSEISGWHVLFSDGSASLVNSSLIKPIDERTNKEKAVDDIKRFHDNQSINTFNESLLEYIKDNKIHGVKWVGDEDEK